MSEDQKQMFLLLAGWWAPNCPDIIIYNPDYLIIFIKRD